MGAALIRSAFSANIKERRDCSTALFDESGRMVAQAEHIPVHLGAMPDAVAAVMYLDPGRDDVFILNDPFAGGTHLPDITLVSRTDVGFAVTRAHHADVGGVEPGSMPAGSRLLEEEGVVIPPTRLGPETLVELAARMRNPDERMGDFRAQLAAHRLAEERIADLCARHGADGVRAAMDQLLAYSERIVRDGIVPASGRPLRVERRARGSNGCAHDPRRRRSRRGQAAHRLRGNGRPARRQPQLPALGHAVGCVLRRPLPDAHRTCPPPPAPSPRSPSLRRRARSSTLSPALLSPEATSRPPAGSSTSSSAHSARLSRCRPRGRER